MGGEACQVSKQLVESHHDCQNFFARFVHCLGCRRDQETLVKHCAMSGAERNAESDEVQDDCAAMSRSTALAH
eukprot:754154-Hanusia_phi.AAC.3